MHELLALSRLIDDATRRIGQWVAWLVLVAAIISAGNAVIRKAFDVSSNSWLELQWLLFAAVFLFAAPWTLSLNEHIRIDILNQRFSRTLRYLIELVGLVFFLLPTAALIVWTSWSFFLTSWGQNEQSSNYGGLSQWPAKLLIPVAFALLFAQGISELIKRIAIMRGDIPETLPSAGHTAGPAVLTSVAVGDGDRNK
jgi:TRAP-type mannitol/chloroaromatic compound transport system permease small subunit